MIVAVTRDGYILPLIEGHPITLILADLLGEDDFYELGSVFIARIDVSSLEDMARLPIPLDGEHAEIVFAYASRS